MRIIRQSYMGFIFCIQKGARETEREKEERERGLISRCYIFQLFCLRVFTNPKESKKEVREVKDEREYREYILGGNVG